MKKIGIGFLSFLTLVLLASFSHKALAAANLSLSPSSGTYNKDSTTRVKVMIDTGGENVNSVQTNFSYPADKLQFLEVDTSGSALTIFAEKTASGGVVRIAGGKPTPGFSGSRLIAAVSFKVLADLGNGDLTFTQDSVVLRDSDNQNILFGKTGASYRFSPVSSYSTPTQTIPTMPSQTVSPPANQTQTTPSQTDLGQSQLKEPQGMVQTVSPETSRANTMGGLVSVIFLLSFILALVFGFYWFKLRKREPQTPEW